MVTKVTQWISYSDLPLVLIGEHHQCKKVIIHLLGPRQHRAAVPGSSLVQIILV